MASSLELVGLTLLVPLLVIWWLLAFVVSFIATFMVVPSVLLAQRMNWACPFIPDIWKRMGPVRGAWVRLGFEASYSINVLTRFLTLPMRTSLPSFYIVGFPKCGTTTMAEYLKQHPSISGTAGLPYHETLSKESHYFAGVLGAHCASSATLYRSFFPTLLTRWWCEVVLQAGQWMCFDACPVHACLPYVAARIARVTPKAKIVVMMRDPTAGVFSAEIMLRNMGVDLPWSLMDAVQQEDDPRFKMTKEDVELWEELRALPPDAPLPERMPEMFYFRLASHLQCGQYADLLEPYLRHFPRENILVVNFSEFISNPEAAVQQVLSHVGADVAKYQFPAGGLQASMKNDYQGRRMHPSVAVRLRQFYRDSNRRLYAMLHRDMGWADPEASAA